MNSYTCKYNFYISIIEAIDEEEAEDKFVADLVANKKLDFIDLTNISILLVNNKNSN